MSTAKFQHFLQGGLAHHRAGRLVEADSLYRQARLLCPRHFDAVHLSGLVAFQLGKIPAALELLGRATQIDPRSAVAAMRYALALLAAHKIAEGEKQLRRSVQLDPKFPEGWENLAYCLKLQDRLPEAIICHQKVASLQPEYAMGWYNQGLTLSVAGRISEALECHERALTADPNLALAIYGRAQALHQAHRIPEAIAAYDEFLRREPKHHEARSYRLFALHSLETMPRDILFAEHVAYGRAVGNPVHIAWTQQPDPARRLRVGILSPDLRAHSCAFFLEPLLQHLDREVFEVYLYHDHFREDAVSARLREGAAQWRTVVGQPAPLLESIVRGDDLDILIDLAGHTGLTNRLPSFAKRLAPVQITYLGYPNTTGVPAMDFRFTDAFADPAGDSDAFATEKLVRFSPCAWSYAPPPEAPLPRATPPTTERGIIFGCFNNPAKITPTSLRLWARILAELPDSRLQLKGQGLGSEQRRAEFIYRLEQAGLPVARVDFLERTPGIAEHLELYNDIDIALDTFPYHGTTTTCEALWMGVPVVSLVGDPHMSRVGASLLAAAGHPEWATHDADGYVAAALALAHAPEARLNWRRDARAQLARGPLLDHIAQARRFGAALRSCWAEWCAGKASATRAA